MSRAGYLLLSGVVLTLPIQSAGAETAAVVEITMTGHAFVPAELKVKAGVPLTLRIRNSDPTAEEFEAKSLKIEKIIAANSEATVRVRPVQPGRYEFVGEYHEDTMKGVLVAE